ncbi:LysR family transcriptional regulator, partial [Acidiphilium sp.]|uniref:LysR family transcriptional regulator n=1 Tax=Acidiphilium sp. TaxID=527 RepID=UPI003D01780A
MAAKPILNRSWIPLNALRAFEAVGRHLSFTAGGQALNVSQSALSRHVQTLETLLGTPLLIRRPHGLELTAAGKSLLPAISRSFDAIEREMNDIIRHRGRFAHQRTLRVHMPPSFLQHIALPALKYFHRQYPDILIDVSATNGIGLPSDRPDLAPDVAVVYDRPQISQTVSDLLWMISVAPVCAPEIAAAHQGKSLEDFLRDNEILHVKLEGQDRFIMWATYVKRLGLNLNTDRGLAFDTASYAVTCAISGAGVALTDPTLFAADIAAGRLIMPYDAMIDEGYGYFLILRPEDLADPVIALFRSWMIEHCARP